MEHNDEPGADTEIICQTDRGATFEVYINHVFTSSTIINLD